MPLLGTEPKQEEQRFKEYDYGPPGSGKTLAGLQFPNSYIIDTKRETDRYYKLIQMKKSYVFKCSNPYTIMDQLIVLRDEPHRFQTLIIDEASTLYSNLKNMWTDKFVQAFESKKSKHGKDNNENLLEDFGFRYWDKVKRDWRRLIDLLSQLDMNVIMHAHQKNKYGDSQRIIGITSDSDKDDEYVWDFVFRLVKRGNKYIAITEKQRVLPVEFDPDAKRFPDEFKWNYDNLIKFYEREYIEKPTKNSKLSTAEGKLQSNTLETIDSNISNKPMENTSSPSAKKDTTTTRRGKTGTSKKDTSNTVKAEKNKPVTGTKENKIVSLLLTKKIPIKIFESFLKDICKWEQHTIKELTDEQKDMIITYWKDKVLPKLCDMVEIAKKTQVKPEPKSEKQKEEMPEEINPTDPQTGKKKTLDERHSNPNYEPGSPIREDQIIEMKKELEIRRLTVERFFNGFSIKNWAEINQEGADNMLDNFNTMIGIIG